MSLEKPACKIRVCIKGRQEKKYLPDKQSLFGGVSLSRGTGYMPENKEQSHTNSSIRRNLRLKFKH